MLKIHDYGRAAGYYLYGLAWVSIIAMVLGAILLDSLNIRLEVILYFWAGHALMRHSMTARKWVIDAGLVLMVVLVALMVAGVVWGTEGIKTGVGYKTVENPSLLLMLSVGAGILILVAVPVILLWNPAAWREFEKAAQARQQATGQRDRADAGQAASALTEMTDEQIDTADDR